MLRLDLRTCVLLVSLMYFLTLVLPFCVPSADSRPFLPGPGDPPPPPEGGSNKADPDDVAVNSARGTGGGLAGSFGFGNEHSVIMDGASVGTGQRTASQEEPVTSIGRDSARWLLLVWVLASQLVTSF
jgi:hypothetical protein